MLGRAGELAGKASPVSRDLDHATWGSEHKGECDVSEEKTAEKAKCGKEKILGWKCGQRET